jgi:hypothetical protein
MIVTLRRWNTIHYLDLTNTTGCEHPRLRFQENIFTVCSLRGTLNMEAECSPETPAMIYKTGHVTFQETAGTEC